MLRIRLSDAQISALECRDIVDNPDSPGARAFTGTHLEFDVADAPGLADWLCEASNAEDAFAEDWGNDHETRKFARRAAVSLSVVYGKVLMKAPATT